MIFLIFFSTLVSAETYSCKDNSTLLKEIPRTLCIDSNCENITITEEIPCQYGCDVSTSSCVPNPTIRMLVVIGIIGFIMIVIFFITRRFM
jgi:hypothetical protein